MRYTVLIERYAQKQILKLDKKAIPVIREVESYQWLKNLLEIVPNYPANLLEKLLPA